MRSREDEEERVLFLFFIAETLALGTRMGKLGILLLGTERGQKRCLRIIRISLGLESPSSAHAKPKHLSHKWAVPAPTII